MNNSRVCAVILGTSLGALILISGTSLVWYFLIKYDLIPEVCGGGCSNSENGRNCKTDKSSRLGDEVSGGGGGSEKSREELSKLELERIADGLFGSSDNKNENARSEGQVLTEEEMLEEQRIRVKERELYYTDMIGKINKDQSLWKAQFNPSSIEVDDIWKIPDVFDNVKNLNLTPRSYSNNTPEFLSRLEYWKSVQTSVKLFGIPDPAKLPKSFDSRLKWSYCRYIHSPTLNQGNCGSCWIVSVTSMLTDRHCVYSNGSVNIHLSAEDVLTCCTDCKIGGNNCAGGASPTVLEFWINEGIVSGGPYGTIDGCLPYSHHSECGGPCAPGIYMATSSGKCEKKCRQGFPKTYAEDKYQGKTVYYVTTEPDHGVIMDPNYRREYYIMRDIMERGPIVACFEVYEDFMHYKSGIYNRTTGLYIYGHCTRMVGWGEERGVKYWIGANSWGGDWGENGFFRILRGENHCGIEDFTLAGIPL